MRADKTAERTRKQQVRMAARELKDERVCLSEALEKSCLQQIENNQFGTKVSEL